MDSSPHIRDEKGIGEGFVTADLPEHVEVPPRGPAHLSVGDRVEVEDADEPSAGFVSVWNNHSA